MQPLSVKPSFTTSSAHAPMEIARPPVGLYYVDCTGPFMGQMFLVVIDAHSKWMEIAIVKSATAQNTIDLQFCGQS